MRRHQTLAAALALGLVSLTGCSDSSSASSAGDPSASASSADAPSAPATEPPAGSDAATAAPSGSPEAARTVPPTGVPDNLPRSRVEAANLHNAYLGRNAAETEEERAVVEAWLSYWQGAADTYYLYRPTELFESVARGRARSTVLDYLAELKSKRQRVMGWSVENVTDITVDGDRATVRDCTESFTFPVDNEIEPIGRVTPYFDTRGTLKRSGGTWTVVDYRDKAMKRSCLS